MADIFIQAFRVSKDYLFLLRDRTQEALAIFTCICVVLRQLESHLQMKGCGSHFIFRIYHLPDEEHRLWIRWPIEEIGRVPA